MATATLVVTVRLDPTPGWGHEVDDFRDAIQRQLDGVIGHYDPRVTVKTPAAR